MDRALGLIKDQFIGELKGETRLAVFKFLRDRIEGGNCEFYFESESRKLSMLKEHDKHAEYDPELHIAVAILIPKGEYGENTYTSLFLFDNITLAEITKSVEEKALERGNRLTRRCRNLQF